MQEYIDSGGVLDAREYMDFIRRRRDERPRVLVCVVCGEPDEDELCEVCKKELPIIIKGSAK